MSNRCAIDKKPDYATTTSKWPIEEFGRFSEEANKLYNEFGQVAGGDKKSHSDRVTLLYENANALNYLFNNTVPGFDFKAIEYKYPKIKEKLKISPIVSVIEANGIADNSVVVTDDNFIPMLWDRYDEPDRDDALAPTYPNILDAYEDYLAKGGYTKSKMGRFCSLAPNIFEGIKDFYSFYDNIMSMANSIMDVISKIKNLGAAGMLKALEDHVLDLVDSIVASKLNFLKNFKFSDVLKMENFTTATNAILAKGNRIKNDLFELFSEANVEKIKKKIQGLIAYAVGVFERHDIEEIEFLVYRFCNLASMIEFDSDNAMMRLKNFTDTFDYASNTLAASSKAATARAIQAGAIRFDPPRYKEAIRTETNRVTTEAADKGVHVEVPMTSGDIDGVTPWNDGKGDSRVYFAADLISSPGRVCWDKVVDEAKVKLMRLQANFGKKLRVNSGYRSPEHNRRVNGKAGSKHLSGTAIDVTWEGFRGASIDEKRRFARIARESGFKGIGGYDSFIHVDLGPTRAWGYKF